VVNVCEDFTEIRHRCGAGVIQGQSYSFRRQKHTLYSSPSSSRSIDTFMPFGVCAVYRWMSVGVLAILGSCAASNETRELMPSITLGLLRDVYIWDCGALSNASRSQISHDGGSVGGRLAIKAAFTAEWRHVRPRVADFSNTRVYSWGPWGAGLGQLPIGNQESVRNGLIRFRDASAE
jgi:hypothetical protein